MSQQDVGSRSKGENFPSALYRLLQEEDETVRWTKDDEFIIVDRLKLAERLGYKRKSTISDEVPPVQVKYTIGHLDLMLATAAKPRLLSL